MNHNYKILEWIKQNYQYILIGLAVVFIAFKLVSNDASTESANLNIEQASQDHEMSNQTSKKTEEPNKEESSLPVKSVTVDIKGAVNNPNTYEMKSTDRIKDVISKAQLKDNADLTKINLSEKLRDQMYIYIPIKDEQMPEQANLQNSDKLVVNINTATKEEIQKIPGVGPSKAEKIIQYRESNGQFNSIDDLKKVKGFGDKTVSSLKEYIIIN
ncbi:helix-hairpin-helix domain-containing protein [Mammaliicoccus stepanovicii]|uniref:Late competence protein ComEA, DNA receptor n=1 Tax=Mammaliicoccus stepanovicii TaxID=643214 RepID=A0A239Z484_9STAP|nr:helix-hairpin-helix domain-containing protein [Mammaliicoccus stepanovicii]PNZ72436.1 hypothetical protein CD111_11290 [Mammaliicoccus stepanovicii]GGI40124.1 competence protein ComE [Mammaliicoccus stepanovicii]SNV65925.1 late competence protein ComEA, DNA receptor [Mammaliicoccus stepanovicii]